MTESFDERTLDEQVAYDEMKRSVEEYFETRCKATGVPEGNNRVKNMLGFKTKAEMDKIIEDLFDPYQGY